VVTRAKGKAAFLRGALPGVLVCLLFKWKMGAPSAAIHWAGLTEVGTYFRFLAQEIFHENKWVYSWIGIILTGLLIKPKGETLNRAYLWLVLINVGYAIIHLTDGCHGAALRNHLTTTFDRLLVHTFPMATVLTFTVLSQNNRAIPTKIIGGPIKMAKR
jgi:hypothetical protein